MLVATGLVYLLFLGTLDTPLVRPLRGRAARMFVGAVGLAMLALFFLRQPWFLEAPFRPGAAPWRWEPGWGPVAPVVLVGHAAILSFALLATAHAWTRQEPGSAAPSRLKVYAMAFGVRDFVLLVDWVILLIHELNDTASIHTSWGAWEMALVPASLLVFCTLISYGILRHQLFDIDLKIKWTLSKGTVAAFFLAGVLVATEGAQVVLGERNPWIGIAAAALLVFALAPLQRVADRLADAAMPDVRDTKDYRTVRKHEVYRAALESAREDGEITAKERSVLATLADQLGLSSKEALDLERVTTGGTA